MSEEMETNELACDWSRVRPVLDHALSDLSAADREAILLRFFEGKPFAEVGAHLRLTENTARMRVERALDKLRLLLLRKGVSSTTGALAIALANQGVVAAPTGLSALISGTALASAGVGGAASVVMTFMSMSKLQLGILGAVAATGTTAFVIQSQTNSALTQEIAALKQETLPAVTTVIPTEENFQPQIDERRSRAYDAELAQLAAETAALQKLNAANDAKVRAAAAEKVKLAGALSPEQLDRFPEATARVAPEYPKELRESGVTGEVLVEFVVDETGTVTDAYAVRSTHRDFEAAAIAGVEKWKFASGLKGGKPVKTRLQQAIAFSLREENLPASTWF